jgi:hypothetical protein
LGKIANETEIDFYDYSINHFFPLSWRELTNRLKKKPFYSLGNFESFPNSNNFSILDDRQEVDQSPSCCQFALEGLCGKLD